MFRFCVIATSFSLVREEPSRVMGGANLLNKNGNIVILFGWVLVLY